MHGDEHYLCDVNTQQSKDQLLLLSQPLLQTHLHIMVLAENRLVRLRTNYRGRLPRRRAQKSVFLPPTTKTWLLLLRLFVELFGNFTPHLGLLEATPAQPLSHPKGNHGLLRP